MKFRKTPAYLLLAVLPFFVACDKDEDDPAPSGGSSTVTSGPGTVMVTFANTVGMVNVDETGATSYTNASNEAFTVTMAKYYVSNFELFNDNHSHAVPDSYFLVDESVPASTELNLDSVPEGYYKGIRFMIGVDEDKYNELTAQSPSSPTGALDPANGMMWVWSTGYIHYKLEGTYANSSSNMYFYHIGGMTGQYSGQRVVELYFAGDSLQVKGTHEAEIHLTADIQKLFSSNTTFTIASMPNVMTVNQNSATVADNYATMFEFDHLHN